MTNFKQYFRSHLKANIKSVIFILTAVLVLTFLIGYYNQAVSVYDYRTKEYYTDYNATLYNPILFLCILAYVIPVMEFSFFKKRINLDCAYSLPINRRTMGTVHYLTGLITLLGTFTASYLLNFILLLSQGTGHYDFKPMIPHYFLCLVLGFAMYSMMVFVFNMANTKNDGIWFMILYTFVFALITFALSATRAYYIYGYFTSSNFGFSLIPWVVINSVTSYYHYPVEKSDIPSYLISKVDSDIIFGAVFLIVIGIVSAIGFFITFGKRRMEKTEDISDSFLGFRTLIPICAICGMTVFEGWNNFAFWFIIEILAMLGYTIYRRGLHYKKSEIIFLCSLLIFLVF